MPLGDDIVEKAAIDADVRYVDAEFDALADAAAQREGGNMDLGVDHDALAGQLAGIGIVGDVQRHAEFPAARLREAIGRKLRRTEDLQEGIEVAQRQRALERLVGRGRASSIEQTTGVTIRRMHGSSRGSARRANSRLYVSRGPG